LNIGKFKSLLLKYSKSKSGQSYYLEGLQDLVKAYPTYLDILPKVRQLFAALTWVIQSAGRISVPDLVRMRSFWSDPDF